MSKLYSLLLAVLFGCTITQAQQTYTFNANGGGGIETWTVPAGITSITAQIWGAGADGDPNSGGYAGGGGGFTQTTSQAVTPGQTITIRVAPGNDNTSSYIVVGSLQIQAGSAEHYLGLGGAAWGTLGIAASYQGGNGGNNVTWFGNDVYGGGGGSAAGPGGYGLQGENGEAFGNNAQGGDNSHGGGAGGLGLRTDATYTPTTVYNGVVPGGGGGGGRSNNTYGGLGAAGRVIITACTGAGSITVGDRTVPYPLEITNDGIAGVTNYAGTYTWEKSTDGSTGWATIAGSTGASYTFPTTSPGDVLYYRRKVATCATANAYSNVVKIKAYTQQNGLLNGTISGKVVSANGTGVSGITVSAQKQVALKGSPQSKIYTAVTDGLGDYTIQNIFYGDLNNGDPSTVTFTITPSKVSGTKTHIFTPTSLTATLSNTNPTSTGKNFTDNTVYSVSGVVTQTCTTCSPVTTDSVTGVNVTATKVSTLIATSSLTGSNGFGKYGITLSDPANYQVVPAYLNHKFTPNGGTLVPIVNDDVANINFVDTSTHTISGFFTAGCTEYIGTATLRFTDTIAARSTPRFSATVTTGANGFYSVRLPARSYKITVTNFSSTGSSGKGDDIVVNDLLTFFNTTIKDSMIKKIDTADVTLNLTYHRKPVLQITNLPDTVCGNYVVFQQNKTRTFTVNIFEGNPATHNCKVATDTNSVKLLTNVHKDDVNETLYYAPTNGSVSITLKGGVPNIVAPFTKILSLNYKDKYGRAADALVKNAVVTGIKTDPGTFTTVSPQIPLLILHDPPGDNSFSFWQQDKTTETAMRFFSGSNDSKTGWEEVKLGTDISTGIGVEVESEAWGSLNASLAVSATINNSTEAIVSTTNSQYYSTSDNSTITGADGDVYIGAAMNLLYSVAHEVKFVSACSLGLQSKLIIADSGFATTYTYSESHIVNNVIPTLQNFAANSTGAVKANYLNQVSVWQQVIANNTRNKENAAFDKNISFDGTTGAQTSTTSSSSTQSNTIEFGLEIDASVALELGFEVGGSGVKGGAIVDFKMESGNSTTNTSTVATTTGYTIDDDDDGDYFSVDIKKDPVYNTPVFSLVAGTSSCPPEPGAQSRDNCQLRIPTPEKTGIAANGEALFDLYLGNTSESGETRTYDLSFVQASNPDGAIVTIGGSPAIGVTKYTVPYLGETKVTVSVKKSAASSVYSYEGLEFMLTDDCDGSVSKTNNISAFFVSPCSAVTLAAPGNNWVVKGSDNNILPIEFNGYTLGSLQSVVIQHAPAGTSSWVTDSTIFQNFITNPSTTTINLNTSKLADGGYDLRLKLVCASGAVYSERVSGIIDRKAPVLYGIPEPTDDNYISGDVLSFTYSEPINNSDLSSNVELRRMSNNAVIPVQVGGYQNKIIIVPTTSIAGFVGDSMRLIAKNIPDLYGNQKAIPDTSYFSVGTSTVSTSPTAVNLTLVKPAVLENSGDSMEVHFKLNPGVFAGNNIAVNYTVSGTAEYGIDYTISYSNGQPASTSFNGAQGKITILKNANEAVLKIKPIGDALVEANETVTITLAGGSADYSLGSNIAKTDTIKNDDLSVPVIYANGSTTICIGATLTLSTANTIDGKAIVGYTWSGPGAGNDQIKTVTAAGSYTVTVFTADGYTGVSLPTVVTISNTARPSLGADQTVYLSCYNGTTDMTSLYTTTGLTSTWDVPNAAQAPVGSHHLVVRNVAGCTDTATVTVILEVATWTGAVSTDWHVAGNWDINKVPVATTHVIIPAGKPECIISAANAVASSLQLRNGSVVKFNNNKTIVINGKCLTLPPN